MHGYRRLRADLLDDLGDGNGAVRAGVLAEHAVSHELGMDEARGAQLEGRDDLALDARRLGDDFCFDGHAAA